MASEASFIPVVYAAGSHFDIGYAVGTCFESRIKNFWNQSERVQETLVPFYDSRRGRTVFEEFLAVSKKCFPEYVSELEGTAQGCGMPFEKIFLINITKEVFAIIGQAENDLLKKRDDEGCSTVFINRPGVRILAHNEDSDPKVSNFGYIISADIKRDVPLGGLITSESEKFTAFAYPGGLPGNAFGFNGDGMVITINSLYPRQVVTGAPTRFFTNRALLTSANLDDCQRIAKNAGFGAAYAFNANLASVHHDDMWSLETTPSNRECRTVLTKIAMEAAQSKPSHYYHTNCYQHMSVEVMQPSGSSQKRLERLRELPAPRTTPDVLAMLGDTANKEFPIFRTPRQTDRTQTAASGVFDLLKRTMSVYKGNPKDQQGPLCVIPI